MIETAIEADEVLEQIKQLEAQIKQAEDEYATFAEYYRGKIASAKQIADDKTEVLREQITMLTESLRRWAEINLPANRKSITLPTGELQFRKADPAFFYDDLQPARQDKRLIQFVKHNAYNFLKVEYKETVDWKSFKKKLVIDDDGGTVYFEDTGEIIDGLHAQLRPDNFTVRL